MTAGHCLYGQIDAAGNEGYYPNISFRPGSSFDDFYGVPVPRSPYGVWPAENWWADPDYAAGDGGQDWGLILLYPDGNGNFPGDWTGTFTAQMNIRYSVGAHVYPVGYPGLGVFASFHGGYGQYFCDTNWDGHVEVSANRGSNTGMAHRCLMTGGASGGPTFVELGDGRWVLGGVNNRGYPNKANVEYLVSAYFDDRLGQFWNSVF